MPDIPAKSWTKSLRGKTDTRAKLQFSFMAACEVGDLAVMDLLLPLVDVNFQDPLGMTPLMVALDQGHIEMAEIMHNSSKLDVHLKTEDGRTILNFILESDYPFLLQAVLKKMAGTDRTAVKQLLHTELYITCRMDSLAKFCYLLKYVDLNYRDKEGRTILMMAALRGKPKFVRLLLTFKKVEVNCVDSNSMTAMHYALLGPNTLEKLKLFAGRKDTNFNIQSHDMPFLAWVAFSKLKQPKKTEIIRMLLTIPHVELKVAQEDEIYFRNLKDGREKDELMSLIRGKNKIMPILWEKKIMDDFDQIDTIETYYESDVKIVQNLNSGKSRIKFQRNFIKFRKYSKQKLLSIFTFCLLRLV